MHTLKVTLKQHTPLIHFQHDQDGATLRASEVKPKLDRFMLTKLGNGNYQEGVKLAKANGWLVGKGEHPSLDYKMRIVAEGKRQEYMLASYIKPEFVQNLGTHGITAISNTPFFAQEKQNTAIRKSRNPQNEWNKIEKKGLLLKGDIILYIIVKDNVLSDKINSFIQSFFVANNFGTRQSKGFGCFTVTELMIDEQKQELRSYEDLLKENFLFVYKKSLNVQNAQSVQGVSTTLQTINEDYRLLKSGLTRPYAKSKLMLYADSLNGNIGWDKKYIKVNTKDAFDTEDGDMYILKGKPEHKQESYSTKKNYFYYRALLGLAEQFEFLLENPPQGDDRNKMIVKVQNEDIQRYQSPLLFKVYENNIYLVGNTVSSDMLNRPFNFLVSFQEDEGYDNESVSKDGSPISTPAVFSLRDFIAFAMNNTANNKKLDYQTIKQ